jgi:hypothetical protein
MDGPLEAVGRGRGLELVKSVAKPNTTNRVTVQLNPLFAIFATFCSIPLQTSVISTTNLPVVFLDSRSRWAWATSGKG